MVVCLTEMFFVDLHFQAPEVLRNEDYDEKADIYSFGVMMYNMFYKVIPTVLIALNGTDEDVVFYAWKVC